ncbi:MAG TPA: thiolase family protein [Candidatus Eisenbacteria bacterium]|nr:thiolase family protein [Candidatus Eisenbacteria bacterium]
MSHAFVVATARTPIGSFAGTLSALAAPALGAAAVRAAVERSRIPADAVEQVIMGNVIGAGLGQAPARQAGIGAGIPTSHGALTVNKVCGSGLVAIGLAAQAIRLGEAEVVVAGGMESMSNAPYLLPQARAGYRLGHGRVVDAMIHDGLWDPYDDFHMGSAAERCAKSHDVSRAAQDAYATESYRRAQAAIAEGRFRDEIVAVEIPGRRGSTRVDTDEEPARVDFDRIGSLKPAFEAGGTITAANASTIADGAAAALVASEAACKRHGLAPRARIVATASAGRAPAEFPIAPVDAVRQVLERAGLSTTDIDLYEINEAFAVVAIACMRALGLDQARVNVHGGAIALGHPIGASGARVLVTLLHALEQRDLRRGLATLCLGGGEAIAMVIDREV